jgi:drug/metabolite transporter (DMT)-like permease
LPPPPQLLGSRIPVLEITLVRSSLSFAATLLIARARAPRVAPIFGRRRNLWKLLGRGVTGSLAMGCYYSSVLLLPMADAATLFFTNPVGGGPGAGGGHCTASSNGMASAEQAARLAAQAERPP